MGITKRNLNQVSVRDAHFSGDDRWRFVSVISASKLADFILRQMRGVHAKRRIATMKHPQFVGNPVVVDRVRKAMSQDRGFGRNVKQSISHPALAALSASPQPTFLAVSDLRSESFSDRQVRVVHLRHRTGGITELFPVMISACNKLAAKATIIVWYDLFRHGLNLLRRCFSSCQARLSLPRQRAIFIGV